MSESTERALRVALIEAAEQVHVDVPLGPEPSTWRVEPPRRPRRPLLVTAAAVLAIAAVIGVLAIRDDGGPSVGPAAEKEVRSDSIPLASADLVVWMRVDASDEQVTAVRDLLEASSDVASFSFDDRDAAYQEFSRIFSCNPDLVDSISPQDLPESFRIVASGPDNVTAVRAAVQGASGVDSVSTGADAARDASPDVACTPQGS